MLPPMEEIQRNVHAALAEDLGPGFVPGDAGTKQDLTARLIPADSQSRARVITREDAILAGRAWFDACFHLLDTRVRLHWHAQDGDAVRAGQPLCEIQGPARILLTAERPGLNFLQTLSGVATQTRRHVERVAGTRARIYDTRKTLPGLRLALKYAVRCGGGENQRIGLYDGILIKENHIAAAGGIAPALDAAHKLAARQNGGHPPGSGPVSVQIEVENLEQLAEALDAGARLILLDNFTLAQMREAVALTAGRAQLEASGGIHLDNLRQIAETGVDRISIGALTKHVQAVDLSMRFLQEGPAAF